MSKKEDCFNFLESIIKIENEEFQSIARTEIQKNSAEDIARLKAKMWVDNKTI